MNAFFDIMGPSLAAGFLLVLIHGALGMHVLARGVIFVDLALAQIAAFGASLAYQQGAEPFSFSVFAWAFAFTLAGAFLFSFFWDREHPVLQEAFIGITFSLASAAAVLVLSHTPHGAEHLQETLSGGGMLWLTWKDVGVLLFLYGMVGFFLFWKRDILWLCSEKPEEAKQKKIPLRLWDLAFYTAFGLTVTSSVKVAGVLAVFSFLIMPVVSAALLEKKGTARLVWSWILGTAGCGAALTAAYFWDVPSGAMVTVTLGALVIGATFFKKLRRL